MDFSEDAQESHDFFSSALIAQMKDLDHPLISLLDLKKEQELALLTKRSGLQDSFRFRASFRARKIAAFLVDENAEFDFSKLKFFLKTLEASPYILTSFDSSSSFLCEYQLKTLKKFESKPHLIKALKKFQNPLTSYVAEHLIFETLGKTAAEPLTDALIQQAVLAASLTPLRQNVGSCFATAPAILIQSEQLEQMFEDLYELLTTGRLKRTFGGVLHSVPLSPSTGVGDLRKPLNALDENVQTWTSPGLMQAFSAAGLLKETMALSQKIHILRPLVEEAVKKKSSITIEGFIHAILIDHYHVSEEEIKEFNRRLKTPSSLQFGKHHAQIDQMILAEKKARSAFKAFCDNALLKAWEFTLASFSEVKMEFSDWNLYSSLGLNPEETGGIGRIVYREVDAKLQIYNADMQKHQVDYQIAFDHVRATEALLKNAARESDIRRLKAEYQSRIYHMHACLDLRDKAHALAERFVSLFSFLIKQYGLYFQEYFQEIYDAEMHDIEGGPYDDSPAGFRLVYKHGRSDASLWSLIYDEKEWMDALIDFFRAIEHQIIAACDWKEAPEEIMAITTAIINHLRTEEFLKTALLRSSRIHHMPLSTNSLLDIRALEKKPWAYTSGGTMTGLLKVYYRRENEFSEEGRWVENASDLLIFILDTFKGLSPSIMNPFLQHADKKMLMSSPTHAFILQPGFELLKEGWQDPGFTYTWVRDRIVLPSKQFYENLILDPEQQIFLLEEFCSLLPFMIGHPLKYAFSQANYDLSTQEFRALFFEALSRAFQRSTGELKEKLLARFDGFLFSSLPLIPYESVKGHLFSLLAELKLKNLHQHIEETSSRFEKFWTSKNLLRTAQMVYILTAGSCLAPFDVKRYIISKAEELKLKGPAPLIFADTNWSDIFFAIAINPGNLGAELWKMDVWGSEGLPMTGWSHAFGKDPHAKWEILTRPFEYSAST
ncbi:MAG: hypothetical protein ACM3JI_02555 [Anaerolineae bacterium]